MKKVLLCIVSAMLSLTVTANADVLGEPVEDINIDMGAYTVFHKVQFNSPSVGNQQEYYIEYTPNKEAVPIVVNGNAVWGTNNINDAVTYMEANNLRPLVGINADYFSFLTGIPMGHTITDGEIVSKEAEGQDAVGFRGDGTAFIDWLNIKTTVSGANGSVDVMCINKWYQPGFDPIYLLTDKFGDSTKTSAECIFVVCSPVEGKLAIGQDIKLRIDDNFVYNGDVEIPDGKMVFVVDNAFGKEEYRNFLSSLKPGDEITVSNIAEGDVNNRWSTVENGLGSVGGRLVKDGQAGTGFDPGAAPRTAVGVKADGNVIFYTLDGRQGGYSYGAQLSTLANRMIELGCVDALNLDGGGSTTVGALFPGSDNFSVVNKPSDGTLRNVSNFIFLKDNRQPTGVPWIVNMEEDANNNYLAGTMKQIKILSVYDTANYKMDSYDLNFEAYNYDGANCSVDNNGVVTMNGTGTVEIKVSSSSQYFNVYENPTDIKIFDSSTKNEVKEIYLEPDEEFEINLYAKGYIDGTILNSDPGLFKWESTIGEINEEGQFKLAAGQSGSGVIKVTAGNHTSEIKVNITTNNPFYDTRGHWAEEILTQAYYNGLIDGLEQDGNTVFKPDNNMTRAEFAAMISNYMKIDMDNYSDDVSMFDDAKDIPEWAKKYVNAMYSMDIITGQINDGRLEFAPDSEITRSEAMTVISRITGIKSESTIDFSDKNDIPQWAYEAVNGLVSAGIVQGYEDNTIKPNNNIKRCEAVVMLCKVE